MPHLQYTAAGGRVARHPIVRHLTSIGSSSECHLVIGGPDVMPTHCTLLHDPGRFMLESAERAAVFYVRGKKTGASMVLSKCRWATAGPGVRRASARPMKGG